MTQQDPFEQARRPVAIALSHDRDSPDLPRIIATGKGAAAEQILALAFAHGVKVRTDADLAEILAAVDIESEIPIAAIAAVAEILAHVYRANDMAADLSATEAVADRVCLSHDMTDTDSGFDDDNDARGFR
jgi:flagellar biosynthesis protein